MCVPAVHFMTPAVTLASHIIAQPSFRNTITTAMLAIKGHANKSACVWSEHGRRLPRLLPCSAAWVRSFACSQTQYWALSTVVWSMIVVAHSSLLII